MQSTHKFTCAKSVVKVNPLPASQPSVAILLATFNGERFLHEQLDSIVSQTHIHWVIYASDDGSKDQTIAILKRYQSILGVDRLVIKPGPKKGLCHNFLHLVADPTINADYYALCDQDDIWLPTKLEAAIQNLQALQSNQRPALYCSRTQNVSETLDKVGFSPLFVKEPRFANALVQNIAGGNTMVFNHNAKALVTRAGVLDAVVHDWWLYILITAANGHVIYDPQPRILYRQHTGAIIGAANSWRHKLNRAWANLQSRHKAFAHTHIQALEQAKLCIHPLALPIFDSFKELHHCHSPLRRLQLYKQAGLYRQTLAGQANLRIAVLLGLI